MFKNIHKLIFLAITANVCNLHCMNQTLALMQCKPDTKTTYEHLPKDIHDLIYTDLLSDFSDTKAIITAKRLSSTCKTQYNLLFDPIKTKFEQFILSDIKLDRYKINDPLLNLFISILPLNYYLLLIEQLEDKAKQPFDQLTCIDQCSGLNETTINASINEYKKNIATQNDKIAQLKSEIKKTKVEKKPLMIAASNEKLAALQDNLEDIKKKQQSAESDLAKIKQSELYKTQLEQNYLFKQFYTQYSITSSSEIKNTKNAKWPPVNFFKNWINAKIDLIFLFWARTLLQPLLYTDEYYKEHAKMLLRFAHYYDNAKSNITEFYKNITEQINNDYIKKKINPCFKKIIKSNLSSIIDIDFPFKNYTDFQFFNEQYTINLPHYVYGLNEQNLSINLHWLNALYTVYKKDYKYSYYEKQGVISPLRMITRETNNTNNILLMLNHSCNVQYNMDKLMQHINRFNPAGTTITIKTVDGIDHFITYNQQFLHCLQNNQYSNITCVFQVPKEKENAFKTFFNQKSFYKWYKTLYYINQNILKTHNKLPFPPSLQNATLFCINALCIITLFLSVYATEGTEALNAYVRKLGMIDLFFLHPPFLLTILKCLGGFVKPDISINNRLNQNKCENIVDMPKLKNIFHMIPWYVIHALLRDTLLIYSLCKYHHADYMLITACAVFDFYITEKSLFYEPLFNNLYKKYTSKGAVTVVPY